METSCVIDRVWHLDAVRWHGAAMNRIVCKRLSSEGCFLVWPLVFREGDLRARCSAYALGLSTETSFST